MSVFIIIFLLLPIIHVFTSKIHNVENGRIIETTADFVILWLVQGLRHEEVGTDWQYAYKPFFENLDTDSIFDYHVSLGFEPGFVVLSKIIKIYVSSDPQIYALVCSFLFIFPIARLFYKYSSNISFSFLVFSTLILYHFGFSGIRQAIAIGITVVSFEFVLRKKIWAFVLTVLVATTIHVSSAFFIITYPIYWYLKLDKRKIFIYLTALFVVIAFLKPIAEMVMNALFIGDAYVNKINQAGDSPRYNMIVIFLFFLFFTFTGRNTQRVMPYRCLIFMAAILQSLALITTSGARMALYYIPYLCVAIPLVTDGYKIDQKIILTMGVAAFLIFFFIYVNGGGYLEVIPYKFFWE